MTATIYRLVDYRPRRDRTRAVTWWGVIVFCALFWGAVVWGL